MNRDQRQRAAPNRDHGWCERRELP